MMKKQVLLLCAIGIAILSTACSGTRDEIISASEWEDEHPEIYASYLENSEMEETTYGGSVPIDYLEKYPYLKILYEGNSFSKEYQRARGHTYALEDIINTERGKPGASCLSCKTSGFLELVDEYGDEAHAMNFEDLDKSQMETISCYDCHMNEPGVIHVTREHLNVALEGIDGEFKDKELVCAQCHVEYYLAPETKKVIMPSVNGLTPKDMLAYYDEANYSDWTHPSSGADLLKVQHPEWETNQGSIHNKMGITCVDCHMPDIEGKDGEALPSHQWTSPLKTIEASCLGCHKDDTAESLTKRVEELQGGVEEKMNDTALMIVDLIDGLKNATDNGISEDQITKARKLHREAQWYWDFVFVENSEGFHNNAKSHEMLDLSRSLSEEALNLLK